VKKQLEMGKPVGFHPKRWEISQIVGFTVKRETGKKSCTTDKRAGRSVYTGAHTTQI
jgi:hypothetical protein